MSIIQIAPTSRLRFAPMTSQDGQLMYELDNDPAVMKYITDGKVPTMEEIERVSIPRLEQYNNQQMGWGLWNAFTLDTDEFIGWVLVRPMDFFSDNRNDSDLELGWRFKQSSWGKGYATEAAMQIMKSLYQQRPEIERFSAIALPDNGASIKIMTKLGMEYIKTDMYRDKQLGDMEVVYYSIEANAI